MKPKNFPERVNARRKAALERLERGTRTNKVAIAAREAREANALRERIAPSLRTVRTKIDRRLRGKVGHTR